MEAGYGRPWYDTLTQTQGEWNRFTGWRDGEQVDGGFRAQRGILIQSG
jgi:hypothetical protein